MKRDTGARDRSANRFEPLGEIDNEHAVNTSMRDEKEEEEKKPGF